MTQEFVTLPREVVEQAISTIVELEYSNSTAVSDKMARDSKAALRAALDQQQGEQEPVAWQYRMRPDWGIKKDCWGPWQDCTREQAAMYQRVKLLHDWVYETRQLYTHPQPKRQPLNDDEILHTGIPEQLWFAKRFGSAPAGWTDEQIRTHNFFQSAVTQLVRAIERAHGIK